MSTSTAKKARWHSNNECMIHDCTKCTRIDLRFISKSFSCRGYRESLGVSASSRIIMEFPFLHNIRCQLPDHVEHDISNYFYLKTSCDAAKVVYC